MLLDPEALRDMQNTGAASNAPAPIQTVPTWNVPQIEGRK